MTYNYLLKPTSPSVLLTVVGLVLLGAVGNHPVIAQVSNGPQTYELSMQGLDAPSVATLTAEELTIRDPAGVITRYQRLARYDTPDQKMIGYASRQAQQVIQWPVAGTGRMRIGTVQNGRVQFDWSKMTIDNVSAPTGIDFTSEVLPPDSDEIQLAGSSRGLARPNGRPNGTGNSLMNLPQMSPMHLSVGDVNQRQFLSRQGSNPLGFSNQAASADSAWYITPVSDNIVRIQQRIENNWMAIGMDGVTDPPNFSHRLGNRLLANPASPAFANGLSAFRGHSGTMPVSLQPIRNGADQLWRINNMLGNGGYCFESVLYPGMALTGLPGRGLSLQPMTYDPWQIWTAMAPTFAMPLPQFRTVQRQIVPNAPLRPITAQIINSHTDTLLVMVVDRRNTQHMQKLRIPSHSSERIQFDRDAGGTVVETVETMDAFGNWNQQQFSTPIPPTVLYDVSVYEEFLQSIAIDRTGKSPNAIEDVNYQPRSVGFFLVPPGDELPEEAQIDAYRIAENAQNPGAVRKLSPRDLQKNAPVPAADPLKDLLNQFQKKRAAF